MRILTILTAFLTAQILFGLEVTDTSPIRNSISNEPDGAINIYFDDMIDINSLSSAGAVSVFGRWSGPAEIDIEIGGFGNLLIINVLQDFFAGEYVMVQLSNTVASLGADNLEHGFAYGFWIRTLPATMDVEDIGHLQVREEGEGLIQCYGAYAGDLNDDGWCDFTVVNENAEDMRIFLSDEGAFSTFTIHDLPLGNKPSSNEGSDLNGDGVIDMVIGNTQGDMVSVVMGEGGGTFSDEVIYDAAQGVRGVTILDFEGDGDMDIASANRQGSNITFFVNDGTGNFSEGGMLNTSLSAETAIIAADMNNDGHTDLVVGGYVSDEIAVLLNDGNGVFTVTDIVDTGDGPWMITMGDVNGDGHIDIAAASSGANQISIHLGDGEGNLSAADHMFTGGFPVAVDLGDLDGDGDLDVISSNYSGSNYTLYENLGTGEFDNETTLNSEAAGSCAIFHDRNNDGVMDITGIDELADVLIFFENTPSDLPEFEYADLRISPNPFHDSFSIDLSQLQGTSRLTLLDAKGAVVMSRRVIPSNMILKWTPDVPAGSYILMDMENNRRLALLIKH